MVTPSQVVRVCTIGAEGSDTSACGDGGAGYRGPVSRSNGDRPPSAYVLRGFWPDADLDPDAPPSAPAAQQLARALRAAMTETATGQRALAATSGVAHTTIGRILAGTVLCDIGSLARLEQALGVLAEESDAEQAQHHCNRDQERHRQHRGHGRKA